MNFDEILLAAVLVMLIASILMSWTIHQSLRQSRQAFEAFVSAIYNIEKRVAELEDERT